MSGGRVEVGFIAGRSGKNESGEGKKEDFYRRERKNGHRSIFFSFFLFFLSFIVYIIVN